MEESKQSQKVYEKLFNAFLAMGLVLIGFTGTLVSLVSIHSLRANESNPARNC